ncbi:MAG: transposase [Chloroflexota bacterium]
MARRAGQGASERRGRALDDRALQGQGQGRRREGGRHRDPRPRLQVPPLGRPDARHRPSPARHRRRPPRRRAPARRADPSRANTARGVWADSACRSAENEERLAENGMVSQTRRPKPRGRPMPLRTRRANGRRSAARSRIEHVFARQKARMGLAIRTIGLARARAAIALANMAYTMTRWRWLSGRAASA